METDDDWLTLLVSGDLFFDSEDLADTKAVAPIKPSPPESALPSKTESTQKIKQARHLEIRMLRDELVQLRSLHDTLEVRRRDLIPNSEAPPPPSGMFGAPSWKEVSNKQQHLREIAVQENLQLRKQLAEIAELGGRLTRQLKHLQTHLQDVELTPSERRLNVVIYEEPHAYGDLLGRLPHLYSRTRVLVDQHRFQLDLMAAKVRDIHISDRSDQVALFEARVVPFDVRATADAVWEWFVHQNHAVLCICDQTYPVDDTLQRSFTGEVGDQSMRLRLHGRTAMRRFDEQDRVVFVTSAQVYTDDSVAVFEHSQWIVITRPPMTTAATAACTEIRCFDTSEVLEVVRSDESRLPQLITGGVDEHRDLMNAFVDTKLIQASRAQRWIQ